MSVLSENLIKEFARITKDDTPKKAESYIYGTAHVVDNYIEVFFDGATDPTPCTTSVTVDDGDRVLVMIKDRQAVITSNVSKPTINADYLEAGEARISGTIHAARYEDSTGNFTMDIGSEEATEGAFVTPVFKIGGYLNGDPANKYYEVAISLIEPLNNDYPLPSLWISGAAKDGPDDTEPSEVGIGLDNDGIHFYGEWIDHSLEVPLQRVNRYLGWL